MIEVVRLQMDSRFNYHETNTVYLNPANIESVETDCSNEDIIFISMVSGEIIVAQRRKLNMIIEKYY